MKPNDNGKYKVFYKYSTPGPAGPFKGTLRTDEFVEKGDTFYWIFGMVEVVKVSKPRKT